MKRFRIIMMAFTLLTAIAHAGKPLELKDVAKGAFRGETMGQVQPMADGESYAQLTADGKRIVQYAFKSGKETATLFDVATVQGGKLEDIDGFQMSPDGRRMLIRTQTKMVYRRSHTATYYIYA